jgi:hypothetical protein
MGDSEFYIKSQDEWIDKYKIDKGSLVKIKRSWPSEFLGWPLPWLPNMNGAIGKTCKIHSISINGIRFLPLSHIDRKESWKQCSYPFYVLEPVKTLDTDNNEEESDRNQKRSRET